MPPSLPSFASAQAETKAALAEVLAVLPMTSPVEQLGEDTFGCGSLGMAEEGSGVSFTDHVAVVQADDFDMDGFVKQLPELLGPSFEVSDADVPVDFALVDVRAIEHGGTQLSVSARESGGERFVEIYASSRCAEPPVER